jgi:hypothetical protein
MKEKINKLPLPVVIIAAIALLGLAGWAISTRIQSDNGSYTANMDRNRYMAEMKKQMGGGQGGGSQYSASGSMQSRGAGGAPGGGSMQRQMMNRGGGGGYGQMQGGGPPPGGMPGGPMGR